MEKYWTEYNQMYYISLHETLKIRKKKNWMQQKTVKLQAVGLIDIGGGGLKIWEKKEIL